MQDYDNSNIDPALKEKLLAFYRDHDLSQLYKAYGWQIDTWKNGFPRIVDLERQINPLAQNNQIARQDILAIADWGGLTDQRQH